MRTKLSLILILGILAIPAIAFADSLSEAQVAAELTASSPLTLATGVADILATNLLDAQAANLSYTAFEPDSLQLSIQAVLKAMGLYVYPGGPTTITDEASEPVVWAQSRIAIDDRLSVSLTPGGMDFGSQPIATPEPEAWILVFAALGTLVMACLIGQFSTLRKKESVVC